MARIMGRLPTVPEYYSQYIDKSVDLEKDSKQCCPFHKEDTPSFSYSSEKRVWRCFGGCKCGGDVIDLHKKNYGFSSREDAERSLNALYGIVQTRKTELVTEKPLIREDKIEYEALLQKALILAGENPDRYVELDYVMSKTPVDPFELDELVYRWSDIEKLNSDKM